MRINFNSNTKFKKINNKLVNVGEKKKFVNLIQLSGHLKSQKKNKNRVHKKNFSYDVPYFITNTNYVSFINGGLKKIYKKLYQICIFG